MGRTILFGGDSPAAASPLGDTWAWDGTGWTQLHTAVSPPARGFSAAAYDPGRRETVLFGGGAVNADAPRNDTWVWDGATWAQRHPAASPPLGTWRMMTYVPSLGRIVLVVAPTGLGGNASETWAWDGTDWTRLVAAASPGAGPAASLYQAVGVDGNGRLLLFGGAVLGPGGDRNETWAFEGGGWHQLHPATVPGGGASAMTFDGDRGQLVMVERDGTWLWDGANWTHLHPAHQPVVDANGGPAGFPAMAYDASSQRVVIVGSDGTWTWDGSDWTRRG